MIKHDVYKKMRGPPAIFVKLQSVFLFIFSVCSSLKQDCAEPREYEGLHTLLTELYSFVRYSMANQFMVQVFISCSIYSANRRSLNTGIISAMKFCHGRKPISC